MKSYLQIWKTLICKTCNLQVKIGEKSVCGLISTFQSAYKECKEYKKILIFFKLLKRIIFEGKIYFLLMFNRFILINFKNFDYDLTFIYNFLSLLDFRLMPNTSKKWSRNLHET